MAAGKVCTGFSKPYVAMYVANEGTISYTGGRVLARGVNVSIEPNSSDDNKFYADNVQAESADGVFTGGTLTLTVDGLLAAAKKFILGLPEAGADGFTDYGDSQVTPYMGVGFIARYMSGGVTTYVPTVIRKTKFALPSISAATQEEEIDWQTQELTATIMRADDANHTWKSEGDDYSSEADAEDALKLKLGITQPVESYSVTQTLTHVTSSFTGDSVNASESFTATLTADDTYSISDVEVTMGGEDITATAYNQGVVTIASASGNIVITAEATQ